MATQITATLPTLDFPLEADYPTQEDWAAFSAAAELNFGILGGSWSEQMQLWKTEANEMSTELNTNATIAQGLANYQGDWISQGYTLGQTVSVSGVYYICKLTHATGQNPTTAGSLYWNLALGNWNLKVDTNMSGYTAKTTPTDADLLPLSDSDASFGIKKLSWANIKSSLDLLYVKLIGNQTIDGIKTFLLSPIAPTPTTGDRSTKVATTALFDNEFVKSFVGNGYQKLPSGLIIQWQQHTTINGTNSVTFPIAFPNGCLAVIPCVKQSALGSIAAYTYTTTTSNITANFVGTSTVFSIGH